MKRRETVAREIRESRETVGGPQKTRPSIHNDLSVSTVSTVSTVSKNPRIYLFKRGELSHELTHVLEGPRSLTRVHVGRMIYTTIRASLILIRCMLRADPRTVPALGCALDERSPASCSRMPINTACGHDRLHRVDMLHRNLMLERSL